MYQFDVQLIVQESSSKTVARSATATISPQHPDGSVPEVKFANVDFDSVLQHERREDIRLSHEWRPKSFVSTRAVFVADLASEVVSRVKYTSPELEERLEQDSVFSLLMLRMIGTIESTVASRNELFEISELRLGRDPENPEWKPIEIRVKVFTKDYDKVLSIWDEVSANTRNVVEGPEDIHIIIES